MNIIIDGLDSRFDKIDLQIAELKEIITSSIVKKKLESQKDGFISKQEAAKLWGCSVSTIDNYRRAGILKKYNIGSAVRFKRSEILAEIEQMNTNKKK